MRFIHLSDLHIGKNVNGFSMLPDQDYILNQILEIIDDNAIDGVLIAGDVYDKPAPPVDAVKLFDSFLTRLSERNLKIFIISGNHDSPERLNFASEIFKKYNIYIAGEYDGNIKKISLESSGTKVNVFMLPYVNPALVRNKLDIDVKSFDECVKAVLDTCDIDTDEKNILVAHQFVTAGDNLPERSESESKSVGGMDNVDSSAFDNFDYVALGHIHGPQSIGRSSIRYSGSPLKYSFSECMHEKSVTIIDIGKEIQISTIALKAERDMVRIKCRTEDLEKVAVSRDSYVHVTLTDEDTVVDAVGKVRSVFPNMMMLDFENKYTKADKSNHIWKYDDIKEKSPDELFKSFYLFRNGTDINEEQEKILSSVIKKLKEDKE